MSGTDIHLFPLQEFEFWSDVAPKTVESFKRLAKTGYFDGLAFHRIIPGFVIQGGDPNTKVCLLPNSKSASATAIVQGFSVSKLHAGLMVRPAPHRSQKGYGPDGTLKDADINQVRKWGTG